MRLITCVTGEIVFNYTDYLKTEHWKTLRKRYKESKFKYKCHACGTSSHLNLHHKSYKRIGKEKLTDMIWLCTDCHEKIHKFNSDHNRSLWDATRIASKRIRTGKIK